MSAFSPAMTLANVLRFGYSFQLHFYGILYISTCSTSEAIVQYKNIYSFWICVKFHRINRNILQWYKSFNLERDNNGWYFKRYNESY